MAAYLDYAAGAPMRPEAAAVYAEFANFPGNPSSSHSFGRRLRAVFEAAKEQLAEQVGAAGHEITFTGSGTEAVNLALQGMYRRLGKPVVLANPADHAATLMTLQALPGAQIVWLPIDRYARVCPEDLAAAIEQAGPQQVAFFACTWVNNELGSVLPLAECLQVCARYDLPVHIDAVAALGHEPIDFAALTQGLPAALSLSGHKVGGPPGSGALVSSQNLELAPIIEGGRQQKFRSGSLDALGAKAFAAAAMAAKADPSVRPLRDELARRILQQVPQPLINSDLLGGSEAILNVAFVGCAGETLLYLLDQAGIAAAAGAACRAGVDQVSHVLEAVGLPQDLARGSIRFSFGFGSTMADVEAVAEHIGEVYRKARLAG